LHGWCFSETLTDLLPVERLQTLQRRANPAAPKRLSLAPIL
jgi:hypothetical protein